MKNRIIQLSIITLAVILGFGLNLAYGAMISETMITVTVSEPIIAPTDFSIDLAPGDTRDTTILLNNESGNDIDVNPETTVTPDPHQEVVIEVPTTVTVPAYTQYPLNVQVMATTSAIPGDYIFTITWIR